LAESLPVKCHVCDQTFWQYSNRMSFIFFASSIGHPACVIVGPVNLSGQSSAVYFSDFLFVKHRLN